MPRDRVKALKFENPDSGGTETDEFPTALDPSEDHLDARGVTLQSDTSNDEVVGVERDAADNLVFRDAAHALQTLSDLAAGTPSAAFEGLFWQDEFIGSAIDLNYWLVSLTGGGSAAAVVSTGDAAGTLRLISGAGAGRSAQIDWGGRLQILVDLVSGGRTRFRSRVRLAETNGNRVTYVGLIAPPDDYVLFRVTGAGAWEAVTAAGGVETSVSTGVAQDLLYHDLEFVVDPIADEVRFEIDGVPVATITTNVPATRTEVVAYQETTAGGAGTKTSFVDFVAVDGDRL